MKEERVDVGDGLTIDLAPYKRIGMHILTEKEMGLIKERDKKIRLLELLKDCFEDEIAHLELRMIRDAQAPRFESLKDKYPEIYRDFMTARNGPHEILLKNRRKRIEILRSMIEN